MELAGKVALVTGAARGLGRAMALALARGGVDVAVSDIARPADGAIPYELASGDDLGETARGVATLGRRSVAIGADVTSAGEVQRMTRTSSSASRISAGRRPPRRSPTPPSISAAQTTSPASR